MAQAFVSAAFCVSIGDTRTSKTPHTCALHRFHTSSVPQIATFFTRGAPLTLFWRTSCRRKLPSKSTSVSIKCEQSTKNSNSLDVWLGRLAMVGFSAALSVEIATGKGLLEDIMLLPVENCKMIHAVSYLSRQRTIEFWAHSSVANGGLGSYSIGGSSYSTLHLPVLL